MADVLATDVVQTPDGTVVEEVRWLSDGTVELHEHGKLVESRPMTADESARFAPPPPDPLATLIADLSKATTLAQVRAAAAKAAQLA